MITPVRSECLAHTHRLLGCRRQKSWYFDTVCPNLYANLFLEPRDFRKKETNFIRIKINISCYSKQTRIFPRDLYLFLYTIKNIFGNSYEISVFTSLNHPTFFYNCKMMTISRLTFYTFRSCVQFSAYSDFFSIVVTLKCCYSKKYTTIYWTCLTA